MKTPDIDTHVLDNLTIDLTSKDLLKKITLSGKRPEIANTAKEVLDKHNGIWKAAIVYGWFEFKQTDQPQTGRISQTTDHFADIDFGYSKKFLNHAGQALVSVCTAGNELENASMNASAEGNHMEAYLIDLISLIVLEKTGRIINKLAENQAKDSGWGLSPFLSPGSVHGWKLEEQIKLCSLLPLEKINVTIRPDAVLSPFKTISSLIALGPGYESTRVGTTCQVCSRKKTCQMRQAMLSHNNGSSSPCMVKVA